MLWSAPLTWPAAPGGVAAPGQQKYVTGWGMSGGPQRVRRSPARRRYPVGEATEVAPLLTTSPITVSVVLDETLIGVVPGLPKQPAWLIPASAGVTDWSPAVAAAAAASVTVADWPSTCMRATGSDRVAERAKV